MIKNLIIGQVTLPDLSNLTNNFIIGQIAWPDPPNFNYSQIISIGQVTLLDLSDLTNNLIIGQVTNPDLPNITKNLITVPSTTLISNPKVILVLNTGQNTYPDSA